MGKGLFSKVLKRDDDEVDVNFDLISPEYESQEIGDSLCPFLNKKNNQILSVWGSPSSGKTLLSVKLARYIASQKKNVVLVLGDVTAPPLPFICSENQLEFKKSLGEIFSAPRINEDVVRQNAILHRRNEYLTMLGYLKGENIYTYPKYDKTHVQLFIEVLREISDCIIIDCPADFGTFSEVAVQESDVNLTVLNCDLKSLSFYVSHENLLNQNSQIKVIADIKNFDAVEVFEQNVGGIHFKIPHSDEIYNQFMSGNLLAPLTQKDSSEYRKIISKIANEVFTIE